MPTITTSTAFSPIARCPDSIQVIVRGECKGLRDIETGRVYDEKLTMLKPGKKGDATTVIPEPTEYAFEVQMFPGRNDVL